MTKIPPKTYWQTMWLRFKNHKIGFAAFWVFILFCIVGVYAPFLASSKPLFVIYDGVPYFPLFRYLIYPGFFTKGLDIFFNLLMFTLPLVLLVMWKWEGVRKKIALVTIFLGQILSFFIFTHIYVSDPAADPELNKQRYQALQKDKSIVQPNWDFDLKYMTPYAKLNIVLRYKQRLQQYEDLFPESENYPSLWKVEKDNLNLEIERQQHILAKNPEDSTQYKNAKAYLQYIQDRKNWLEENLQSIHFDMMPLLSPFHWEDDAGGSQAMNQYVPWWKLTRINRKDLLSALIFGIRISLTVGVIAVFLALLIGIPIGALAGFYGGKLDIAVSRLLEIWESMPIFFMLLMVVSILQSKSIFLVISVIGLFGWTSISRYIRGEFFKQRNLPYVEACRAQGFSDPYTMFKHILPNAIPPVLTLLPFAMMGAITSEAGLSFVGLGEEGSCSWGVLMDEGRSAFPQESYLLWPPAILLTILLIAIALVGDALRDTLDPKLLHK